jgi:hypothetical protein
MLYLDYIRYKIKYLDAQEAVNVILDEKTLLFQKTQPKSMRFENERVDGGTRVNQTEEYVIAMEQRQINERLSEAKTLLLERRDMLDQKEAELRVSKAKDDVVYVLKYLEHLDVKDICHEVSYSESQVYRILKIIRRNLNMIENERK